MSEQRHRIGEFAHASGLTPKALRLYDEMGLLSPAEVDDATGYRWYADSQLDRARLVARLRLLGMPLARIRVVVDLPHDAAAAELTSYWRQVEADTASAGALVRDLVAGLRGKEHDMTTIEQTHPEAAVRIGIGARATQQDATRVADGVYAVADGFGSADGLAQAAVAELDDLDLDGDLVSGLDEVLARAATTVAQTYADQPGAGTTLTVLVLREGRAVLAHVGDSRAHLVREGRLERLTRDHSVVQTLIDEGRLTAEEARADDRRVQLNRAIAVDAAYLPDLSLHATRPGDRYVLTTDGVHRELEPADLAALLGADGPPEQVAAAVADAVEAAGAADNYSVLVIDLPA